MLETALRVPTTNIRSPRFNTVLGPGGLTSDSSINLVATTVTENRLGKRSSAKVLAAKMSGTSISASTSPLRSEEHTSELQSRGHLVCRLLLEKKKTN